MDYKTIEKTEENEDQFGFFWEMTDAIPIRLDKKNAQQFIKIGHKFEIDVEQSIKTGSYSPPAQGLIDFNNSNPGFIRNVVGASTFTPGLGSGAWSHVPNQPVNPSVNTGLPIISNEAFCELTLSNQNLLGFNFC